MSDTLLAVAPRVDDQLTAPQVPTIAPSKNRTELRVTDTEERELSLSELASAINYEHHLCQESYKASLVHARRTGELLLQAKSKVKSLASGRWLPWLEQNCHDIPKRTAQAYMQVAANWKQLEKSATVALFGLKDALKLLSGSRVRGSKKTAVHGAESPDAMDAEWTQAHPSQEPQLSWAVLTLEERDRVVVTDVHPLFAGQHGTITGRPSTDAAVVALDEGEREYILIRQLQPEELKPQNLVIEPKSKDKQLLPSIPPNPDALPNEPPRNPSSLVNTVALAHGKPDVVATEIAIGLRHLTPEQLAWVVESSSEAGLSDAHLKGMIKAAKRALNRRHHPEYGEQ